MALGNQITANNGNGSKRGQVVKMRTLCGFILSQRRAASFI
jgi:hypothetical protein